MTRGMTRGMTRRTRGMTRGMTCCTSAAPADSFTLVAVAVCLQHAFDWASSRAAMFSTCAWLDATAMQS
jgi:hypothetical protein